MAKCSSLGRSHKNVAMIAGDREGSPSIEFSYGLLFFSPGGSLVAPFFRHPGSRIGPTFFFVGTVRKRPYLNITKMEVEIFEIPESPQRVRIATERGDAKCFIQANSWHSGCDEVWKSWNQFATGVRTQRQSVSITDSTLPWHRALALE